MNRTVLGEEKFVVVESRVPVEQVLDEDPQAGVALVETQTQPPEKLPLIRRPVVSIVVSALMG